MNKLISDIANTHNIDVINRIISVLEKHGRVYVIGKMANDKAKMITSDTVVVSDECNVVCCGVG